MIINPYVFAGPTYDTDAQAYFTANTAITSGADKNAINQFYLDLKSFGIYSKLRAMYLWKWGSASADKWNMINPQDTNSAFRCNFATGFTYSTSGITANGTSAYVDTFLVPSTTSGITQNSISGGVYCRTNKTGSNSRYAFGLTQVIGANGVDFGINMRTGTNNSIFSANDATGGGIAITDSRGFYQVSRTNSTSKNRGLNTYSNVLGNSSGVNTLKVYFFAYNSSSGTQYYDNYQSPFGYIGTGLTLTEMANFRTCLQTLMTYFGINV
jgi:hypothetical protein